MQEEKVVLCDEQGNETGLMGKLEAHEKGLLHRAISIIVWNAKGEMLVQQRAFTKYHFGGIWSNTCCSHPRQGESFSDAAHRRLKEELGFETKLTEVFRFVYTAKDEASALTEHEYDAVFTGIYNGPIQINTQEVNDVKWMRNEEVLESVSNEPDIWSFWFKVILREMQTHKII